MNERIDFDMMDLLYALKRTFWRFIDEATNNREIKSREIYVKSVDISRLALKGLLYFKLQGNAAVTKGHSRIAP